VSSSAAERVPSFDELYRAIAALPEGLTGEILEPGTIRAMSRPGAAHRFTASRIPRSLSSDDAVEGGRWWLEQEAEIRLLVERLVVPDLAGWRLDPEEDWPPSFVRSNPIDRCPHWCAEVLSQSTEVIDRHTKVPLYAKAGVEWIWLVDPIARTIEILRCERGQALLAHRVTDSEPRSLPPFETLVDTSAWWLPDP
jgi:Uma2 family endonuclease